MLTVNDKNPLQIKMIEGDYGINLPIVIQSNDIIFTSNDTFSLKIFKKLKENPLITKTYSNIEHNTINFELTKAESQLLPVGAYYYELSWYQDNVFMCNIIAKNLFFVEDKASYINYSEIITNEKEVANER